MREIKFRAWDSNDECMVYQEDVGEDFDFQVYQNHLKLLVNEQHHECGSGVAQEYWKYVEREAVFMQFAGLKDKNSIDVYDGDVIKGRTDLGGKLKRFIGVVNVNLPSAYVQGVKQYSWKRCNSIFDVSCFEVIGNIYENPELLEKPC